MANWFENTLRVYGNESELKRFKESVLELDEKGEIIFTLNKLVPTPPELLDESPNWGDRDLGNEVIAKRQLLTEKYGFDNWYDWRENNWGTTRDAEIGGLDEEDDKHLRFFFRTANITPFYWFRKVSKIFPTLTMKVTFGEHMCEICGAIYCADGVAEYNRVDMAFRDDNNRPIERDRDGYWIYSDTLEFLEDQNIYPRWRNPFSLLLDGE